jgi:hypothetical protein
MDLLQPINSSAGSLQLVRGMVPSLFADAGTDAARRFIEFFTANIRNRNTRAAYAFAVARFARWCDTRGFALAQLTPVIVAAYIEELGQHLDKPSVKQHLAALRMGMSIFKELDNTRKFVLETSRAFSCGIVLIRYRRAT